MHVKYILTIYHLPLYTPDVIHTIPKKIQDECNIGQLEEDGPKTLTVWKKRLCALSENIIEMHVFQGEWYDEL